MTTTVHDVSHHALDATETTAVLAVAESLCARENASPDDPRWVADARRSWEDLPLTLRESVRAFRRDSGAGGTLLVRGLPVDPSAVPATPLLPGSVQRTASVPAAVLLMLSCGLGDPMAFGAEKGGALVQDVVPIPGRRAAQSNEGSDLLTFHSENAFHPHRPDHVLLLCLRADHDRTAGLRTACIRRMLPLLSAADRDALSSMEFETSCPPSFGQPAGTQVRHAVLAGDPDDPDLCVDFAATTPVTTRAEDALRELGKLCEQEALTVRLAEGDLAVVDNRTTVHGRTSFTPRFDGQDRWLQRTFVATDLRRSRAHRPDDGYVLR